MGGTMKFNYYYGIETEQFSFYRVPRILIKDARFKDLSSDAKFLYGLMLNRMLMSIKNGWLDEENRAYIIYTMDNIMEDLGCSKPTCTKIMRELDSDNGIGLIEKKRRGLGRPDIIYVKNFASTPEKTMEAKPASTDVSAEVKDFNFKKQKDLSSGSKETEPQEVNDFDSNYTNPNQNNMSYNNPINQSESEDHQNQIDMMDDVNAYIELIKENIEYDHHMQYDDRQNKELYDELFEVICDIVCVKRNTVRIAGENYPHELVKSKFLKLDSGHLEYVIRCMHETNTKITNIKAYMLTALYNAPTTINHYYQQEVQHDMYGGGWEGKGVEYL